MSADKSAADLYEDVSAKQHHFGSWNFLRESGCSNLCDFGPLDTPIETAAVEEYGDECPGRDPQ